MGFDGYYVKLGSRIVPNEFILADSYSAKLNKEEYAERDANRDLHRDVIAIKPSVKFTIRSLKSHEMDLLLDIIEAALLVSEEDKVNCTCWIPKERRYRTFDAYIPDTEYAVRWSDRKGNPKYQSMDIELISY